MAQKFSFRWAGLLLAAVGLALLLLGAAQNQRTVAKGVGSCSAPYLIDITLPNNARWSMCWEERANEGIVLYDVTYTPPGGPQRLVLAQANLGQLHVPYDDNGSRLHDLSDFGLGGLHLADLSAAECPGGTLLQNNGKSVLCQTIAERGPAFKYYGTQLQGQMLALFSISTVGAYNYIVQWNFYDSGDIEPAVGATGRLQFYADATGQAHGWPLDAANTVFGVSHTHNYTWRLDFDLVSAADDVVEEIEFAPSADRSQFSVVTTSLLTETARQVDQTHFRSWRVKDTAITNSDGHAISYQLEPDARQVFRGPAYEPWTQAELYVTRYNPCEKWASHNPTLGGCADNLSGFVNGQSVNGADVVLWYGHSFHHLPRDEDESEMHSHWNRFLISPRDWTADNPLTRVTPVAPTPTLPPTAAQVQLADFSANWHSDNRVDVSWQTFSEINTASFSLLRSTNSLTWTQVFTTPALHPCQNYTGTTPTGYGFSDTGVISPSVVSYRLEFVGAGCGAQSTAFGGSALAWPHGHIELFLPVVVKN